MTNKNDSGDDKVHLGEHDEVNGFSPTIKCFDYAIPPRLPLVIIFAVLGHFSSDSFWSCMSPCSDPLNQIWITMLGNAANTIQADGCRRQGLCWQTKPCDRMFGHHISA